MGTVQLDLPNSNDNPEQTITQPRTAWKSLRIRYATRHRRRTLCEGKALLPHHEPLSTLTKALRAMIASALRLSQALSAPEEDVDINRSAHSFGADSLVAVELQFWFADETTTVELSVLGYSGEL
ncbi:hypothetical protein AbraIFM66950_003697 [Aspergillus brasiliensis]|nr:hypothetical protein AbraIFM66950_003697 [Aspergillus brasiliensis]